MAYNSKYTGEEVEELLDKIKGSQLWGYECFAVKKDGMDDPDVLKQEIEAFIEAGGGDAEPLIQLIKDAGLGNAYVQLVNSDEGASVVTINGSSVTIDAGATYEGYVDRFSAVTLPTSLSSVIVIGDVAASFGDSNSTESAALKTLDIYFSNSYSRSLQYLCAYDTGLERARVDGGKATSLRNAFYGCTSLKSLDLTGLDMSQVTSMYQTFRSCSALTSLDVSGFNTSQVTTMQSVFNGCSALTSLDVSGFNTSQVTTMMYMFQNCSALTSLDLSNFNTSQVTNMNQMFRYCSNLVSINFGDNWDMGSVTDTTTMFGSCSALTTITGMISNIKVSLAINNSPLTRESALVFINGLSSEPSEENPTLTLRSTTKELLTDDDIKIATDKGWTIA